MAYGIEVKNQDGIIILDNSPYSVLAVIESGTYASGTNIPMQVDPNAMLFIRPTITSASIYGGVDNKGWGSNNSVNATSGTISYVKMRPMSSFPVSGYGLAIYDNTGSPLLVFTDSAQYVRLMSSTTTAVTSTITIPMRATLSGKYKYINRECLGIINQWTSGYDTVNVSFSAAGDAVYLDRHFFSQYNYAPRDRNITKQYNVIEC